MQVFALLRTHVYAFQPLPSKRISLGIHEGTPALLPLFSMDFEAVNSFRFVQILSSQRGLFGLIQESVRAHVFFSSCGTTLSNLSNRRCSQVFFFLEEVAFASPPLPCEYPPSPSSELSPTLCRFCQGVRQIGARCVVSRTHITKKIAERQPLDQPHIRSK